MGCALCLEENMAFNSKTLALCAVAACTIGAANAVTFATFADPSSGTPPLFTIDLVGNTFTGSWSGTGLTLNIPMLSESFNDATFSTVAPISYTPSGPVAATGGGEIDFFDSSNALIFKINFDSGLLSAIGFGASEFTSSSVTFSGPGIPATENDQFSFSFANVQADSTTATATASFTSSANPVPEPVSMATLGIGLAGVLARRRRRA